MYSVSNSISGVIMVIMIISFRTKTNTDFPDHTDTYKKEGATPDPSIREGNKKEDEQFSSSILCN